ncbi:MAG: nucleotidyltransferase family protein [Candidatus Hodarchaeales archaeon]
MTLLEYLRELSQKALTHENEKITLQSGVLKDLKQKTVVILPAGGEGTRARSLTGDQDINKAIFGFTEGKSLIEITIGMYRDAGFRNFLCLTYFRSESVRQKLGDGSSLGVSISYSEDPGYPAGRGGAILNALETGALPRDRTGIISNPDDIIHFTERPFPELLLETHIRGMEKNARATIVVVPGTPYTYTGMAISDGFVSDITMYPMVPIPAHVGITVIDSSCWELFDAMIERGKKVDFESVILPRLAEEGTLYACVIPYSSWFPVNDLKGARRLKAALKDKK